MIGTANSRPDSGALGLALFSATLMIAHQVAGKAVRDALFLSHFDVTHLPKVVIVAAILSLAGVMVMSGLLTRNGPAKLVPATFGISAILFVGEWSLFGISAPATAVVLYLHMALFGAILISGFWSVINERFDPHSAKKRIARIAAAATLGGIIGGIVAQRVTVLIDVRAMLLVLSVFHLICALSIRGIGAPRRAAPVAETAPKLGSGINILKDTPYLQWMGLLMILIALVASLADYAFKAEASARYTSSEGLVTFFATFYAVVGALAFGLQTLLGPALLQRFGIGTVIAILPTAVFLFGIVGTVFTQLWSLVTLRGSHAIFANSFHRTSFELLYTPLPPGKKRPTKTIIDVASDRIGDMLGGGCILALLWLIPDLPTAVITAVIVLAAAGALYVVRVLYRGYVDQLAQSLHTGVVEIDEKDVIDATTRQIFAETSASGERELLEERLRTMEESREPEPAEIEAEFTAHGELSDGETDGIPEYLPDTEPSLPDRLGRAIRDLGSGDPEVIKSVLHSDFMDIRLTPYLVPLLANDEVADDARTELRWVVPRIIGQLTDALLDPEIPLSARQRLPGILEASHNPRTIDALLYGLTDDEFSVRYSCARALARMQSRNAALAIPEDQIFEAVRAELQVDPEVWEGRRLTGDRHGTEAEVPDNEVNISLEHVFTVLGLVLDRDALKLATQAVTSDDPNLRGTALEYLENVLPDDLRRQLWRHLGAAEGSPRKKRSRTAVLNELKSFLHTK